MENADNNLQKAVAAYLSSGNDDKYDAVEDELLHILRTNGEVWIDGMPIEGKPGHYNPAGMTTVSNRFHLIVYSTRENAEAARAAYPMSMSLRTMVRAAITQNCDGIAIDFIPGQRTVLLSKKVLQPLLDIAQRMDERLN